MNILQELPFDEARPAVLYIRKTENLNLLAVGLLKGQSLNKHKTNYPTLLTVLQGWIEFKMGDEVLTLKQFDTFEIPVGVEHEVEGLDDKNAFSLTMEK